MLAKVLLVALIALLALVVLPRLLRSPKQQLRPKVQALDPCPRCGVYRVGNGACDCPAGPTGDR